MIAIYAAVRQPEIFKAVCGCEPSGGDMSMAKIIGKADNKLEQGATIATEKFGTIHLPPAYFRDRLKFHTVDEVQKLKMPLLLIAGSQDTLVPAKKVHEIYEAANEPKQYLEFSTDHFYKRNPEMLAEINTATVAFFDKCTV